LLRGITAEIDLEAAALNLNAIRETANNLPVIAVVKADAYGHGAPELARTFREHGASALAVAFVSEAKEIRESGMDMPILVLFDSTEVEACLELGLTPVLHSTAAAEAFSKEASRRNSILDVHVKVDTGMGRMGLTEAGDVLKIAGLSNLNVAGLLSHLSEADIADREYVELQLKRFQSIRESLNEKGLRPLCHIANSAAALSMDDCLLDAIRPGIALYGCSPFGEEREGVPELRPVMRAKSAIVAVKRFGKGQPISYGRTYITGRETTAAVLAVGYADGFSRALSNRAEVIVRGRRATVMGRVCMDLTVVDVTDAGEISERDEAVILGRDGSEEITAWELAENASTIPYEIMTSLGRCCRKRTYLRPGTDR
jgi:alanine racemase